MYGADGVRINQQDEAEKGGQVQQMGTVYEIATHTVILLGEGDGSIESSLSFFLSQSEGDCFIPLEEDDKIAAASNHLLVCSWLYRVWIFRELVLSRDPMIQYSDIRFPWSTLCNVASFMANTLQYMRLEAAGHNSILLSSYSNISRQVELNLCQKINIVIRVNWVKWNARSLIEKRQCSNSPNILPEGHPEDSQNWYYFTRPGEPKIHRLRNLPLKHWPHETI
jgi:hypothetical protein